MTIGSNEGGQLNVFLFETGMMTRDPSSGVELVQTISLHPLVVAPTSIRYDDATRAAIDETPGQAIETKGGRALRMVSFDGTFGVESRGIGPYIGNGEIRFRRFYQEVVRLGDAISKADVDAASRDFINQTPGLPALLRTWDPQNSVFFVNFYDFWNGISFRANVQSFRFSLEARRAAATGCRWYAMSLREVGPVLPALGPTGVVVAMLNGLATLNGVNNLISSFTPTAIINAGLAIVAPLVSELSDTVEAVSSQVLSVTSLLGGQVPGGLATTASVSGLQDFFASAEKMADAAGSVVDVLLSISSGAPDNDTGQVDLRGAVGEGGNRELDTAEQVKQLRDVQDAGLLQAAAGGYFGMGRDEYRAYVTGSGVTGLAAPEVGGSIRHEVTETDTPVTIEAAYGVSWDRILEVNGLTPGEAMVSGVALQVPRIRPRGPSPINGLPVLGSHIGQEAWGRDLPLELVEDTDGDLAVVESGDCLAQGVTFLVEAFGEDLTAALETVPEPARASYLGEKVRALLAADPRVVGVNSLNVEAGESGFDVDIEVQAINGGTVRSGGGA